MPGFFHYGFWDHGHDCGAAGPLLGLPFSLSCYSCLRRPTPGSGQGDRNRRIRWMHPSLLFKFIIASFVVVRLTRSPPYWRAIEGIDPFRISKVFATLYSFYASRVIT